MSELTRQGSPLFFIPGAGSFSIILIFTLLLPVVDSQKNQRRSGFLQGGPSRRVESYDFIHVKPLSIIYRAKFRDAMKKAGLFHFIGPTVWQKDWVVHSKAVGDGRASLKYLAPYVFRVAISNARIVSYDNHQVLFRYKKSGSNRLRTMTLDAMEFIRRFLQHVLPHGFMKIRHYGLLSSNCSTSIEKVRELISVVYEVVKFIVDSALPKPKPITCKQCGHAMQRIKFISARNRAPG